MIQGDEELVLLMLRLFQNLHNWTGRDGVEKYKEDGKEDKGGFNEEDEEIADSYSVWGEVALHYADLYSRIERQRNLSGFLLNVVRYVF